MSNANWLVISGIIGINAKLDDNKRIKVAQNALCQPEFDLGVPCERCGGSGHYSFNPMDGTRCYGCDGKGQKPPSATDSLVEAVKSSIESDDSLNRYVKRVQNQKKLRNANNLVFKAWEDSGVASAYTNFCKAHDSSSDVVKSEMFAINKEYSELAAWAQKESFKVDPSSKTNTRLSPSERFNNMVEFWDTFEEKIKNLPILPDDLKQWVKNS